MSQECYFAECDFHPQDEPICNQKECRASKDLPNSIIHNGELIEDCTNFIATLNFSKWLEVNDEELDIIFAESGADREYDFDFDNDAELIYNRKDNYAGLVW